MVWLDRHPARVGTLAGWFQQSASIFAALLVVPVLMRMLSADNVGRWFAFQGFLNMANLVDFGVGFAVSRQAAHCFGGGKKEAGTDFLEFGQGWDGLALLRVTAERIKHVTLLLAAIVGTVIFELVLPHTPLIPEGEKSTFRLVWYAMMGSTLLITATAVENTILNGMGKVYLTRLMTGAFFFTNGLLVMVAALVWGQLWTMAVVSLISALIYRVGAALALRWTAPEIFSPARRKLWKSGMIWPLLKVAAPVGFVNVGAFFVSSIQTPLVGSILGPAAVAPFYLAQKMGQFLNQVSRQYLLPQIPFFTRQLGSGNYSGARKMMLKVILLGVIAAFTANLIFFLLSPQFARMLTGKDDFVDTSVLALMSIDYFILSVAVFFSTFVMASGKNPFVISTLICGGLNIALLAWLVPVVGTIGIPLSSLLSGLLTNYWYAIYQGKIFFYTKPAAGQKTENDD